MKNNIDLEIITPHGVIPTNTCDKVILPGEYGIITILPEHTPFLSALKHGEIVIKNNNKITNTYFINGGFLQITKDKATVLVDVADTKENIDLDIESQKKNELENNIQKSKNDQEKLTNIIALEKTTIRIKMKQEVKNDNL